MANNKALIWWKITNLRAFLGNLSYIQICSFSFFNTLHVKSSSRKGFWPKTKLPITFSTLLPYCIIQQVKKTLLLLHYKNSLEKVSKFFHLSQSQSCLQTPGSFQTYLLDLKWDKYPHLVVHGKNFMNISSLIIAKADFTLSSFS